MNNWADVFEEKKVKRLLLVIILCSCFTCPLWAQNRSSLEQETIEVVGDIGKSVVSISSVIKQKIGEKFFFGFPFGELENNYSRGFFQEFFGEGLEREYKRMGLGSGVIIDKTGYILTNEHVISGHSNIKVKLFDGREFDIEIKGTDSRSDIALIKIDAKNLTPAKLGDSDKLNIGQWVVAAGNPFGFATDNSEPTVTIGVVSALHRYLPGLGMREKGYSDLIQTDAAINPGNSGGPLVNLKGEVIGINTAVTTTTGVYQGLGFAVGINKAKKILDKLLKGEKILYGWLGVNIQDLNDDLQNYFAIKESQGIVVLKVYDNSPAQKSGLKEGDLILTFNHQPVRATRDLISMVSSSEVGERVPMKILRANKGMNLNVKIGTSPDIATEKPVAKISEESFFRGMRVESITQEHKSVFNIKSSEGVVVVDIEPGSIAAGSRIVIGDVITKIDDKNIKGKEDFDTIAVLSKDEHLVKTERGYFVLKGDKQ
jgi:serine protease Do